MEHIIGGPTGDLFRRRQYAPGFRSGMLDALWSACHHQGSAPQPKPVEAKAEKQVIARPVHQAVANASKAPAVAETPSSGGMASIRSDEDDLPTSDDRAAKLETRPSSSTATAHAAATRVGWRSAERRRQRTVPNDQGVRSAMARGCAAHTRSARESRMYTE